MKMKLDWRFIALGLAIIFLAVTAHGLDANAINVNSNLFNNPSIMDAAGGLGNSIGTVTSGVFGFIASAFKGLIGLIAMATGWTIDRASLLIMGLLLMFVAWQSKAILAWIQGVGQYLLIGVGIILVILAILGI